MAKDYRETKTFLIFDAFKNADVGHENQTVLDLAKYTETAQY
jgi:hypothetical protein